MTPPTDLLTAPVDPAVDPAGDLAGVPRRGPTRPGTVGITAAGLTTVHRGGTRGLDGVTVAIEPGCVTAVIGPSGAGKTTLLAALAGVVPAQQGEVTFQRGPAPAAAGHAGIRIGYVPQDDILHGELPLRRTLRYSAALRLDTSTAGMWAAVDDVMETLGLQGHGDVRVDALSGGQRKRASIACEILTDPDVCFLDEPTSGLDPSAAADLVACLGRLADRGATVVFTTHSVPDIERADRVVALAPGGRLVATGTPDEVLARLGAADFTAVYELLTRRRDHEPPSGPPHAPGRPPARRPSRRLPERSPSPRAPGRVRSGVGPGGVRQWLVLTRRSAETILRNRLTLAILVGSPAAVIVMFAVLFQPGGADPGSADPAAAVMVAYWLAFAGFFFGLTFGLLQVCAEVPVLRREHHAGVRSGAYLGSKVALLAPFLLVVNAAMVVCLLALDRLPGLPAGTLAALLVTMALNAVCALCLGLAASAAVTSTAQAALALPMICFPAVLFAGGVVPVSAMADAGRAIAAAMPDRWAFEAIAGHLDVAAVAGPSSPHAGLGVSGSVVYWALLAGFTVVLAAAAYVTVERRAAA